MSSVLRPSQQRELVHESPERLVGWGATALVIGSLFGLTGVGHITMQAVAEGRSVDNVLSGFAPEHIVGGAVAALRDHFLLDLSLIGPLLLAVALQRWRPVRRGSTRAVRSVIEDAFWYAMSLVLALGVVGGVQALWFWLVGGPSRDIWARGADFPLAIRFVFALLVLDFARYWSHRLRHRVAFLWEFHAVHHSQRNMNPFTEHRVHPFELVLHYSIFGSIVVFCGLGMREAVVLGAIGVALSRLYHSRFRADYGILRYVLVTPQSHRIHHSLQRDHFDANFGTTLSIWDRIFGTHVEAKHEYPDEGVEDARFPTGHHTGWWEVPRVWASQVVYPFATNWHRFRLTRSGTAVAASLRASGGATRGS